MLRDTSTPSYEEPGIELEIDGSQVNQGKHGGGMDGRRVVVWWVGDRGTDGRRGGRVGLSVGGKMERWLDYCEPSYLIPPALPCLDPARYGDLLLIHRLDSLPETRSERESPRTTAPAKRQHVNRNRFQICSGQSFINHNPLSFQ